ncbi:MAG: SIS domain-containing protein [Parachlamydiaceae bacterium]
MVDSLIKASAQSAVEAAKKLQEPACQEFLVSAARLIADAFRRGNKILIAGNGGSLADALHFAEELTGFFRNKRRALPAIALADPAHISCVGNDVGFDQIFSRGVEAHGRPGDVFIGLTTSGNSMNLIKAFEAASKAELHTVAFLGKTGGQLRGTADLEWIVDGFPFSDRIQEAHMAAIHILIEAVEALLFFSAAKKSVPEATFETVL